MKTPLEKLANSLEEFGWKIERENVVDLEWWADEIWEIKSIWSPEGVTAFITFLVDPQHEGIRNKRQAVWGVSSSPTYPNTLEEARANGVVSLNDISKLKHNDFLQKIEVLRSGAINDIGL